MTRDIDLKTSLKILVVDDEQATRDYLVFHLNNKNYPALPLESGEALLDSLGREIPDIILLDIFLPDVNGLELCSRIKTDLKYKAPGIIVMSAWVSQADMASYLSRGADAFIQKPVNPKELLAQLESLLKSRQDKQKLKQSTNLLENILNNLPVPVAVMDPGLELVRCNQAWLDFAGTSLSLALNRKCFQVLGRHKPCKSCPVLQSAATGKQTFQKVSFSEHEPFVLVSARPLPDEDNQTLVFVETLLKPGPETDENKGHP